MKKVPAVAQQDDRKLLERHFAHKMISKLPKYICKIISMLVLRKYFKTQCHTTTPITMTKM